MADIGAIRSQLGGIKDADTKRVLTNIFEYLLANLRLGVPEHQTRATNLQAYWQSSTTAADGSEFSIAHGLASTPRYAIPVLPLGSSGGRLVPLTVTRPADDKRVYLQSASTSAPFVLLVE